MRRPAPRAHAGWGFFLGKSGAHFTAWFWGVVTTGISASPLRTPQVAEQIPYIYKREPIFGAEKADKKTAKTVLIG